MRPGSANMWLVAGGLLALILIVAAVWAASMSTPTRLALTGLLVLMAVGVAGAFVPRGGGSQRAPVDEDADQRERMRDRVP